MPLNLDDERDTLPADVCAEIQTLVGVDLFKRVLDALEHPYYDGLDSAIGKLLEPLFGNKEDEFQKLEEVRVSFEAAFAQMIAHDPEKRLSAKSDLAPIHQRMVELARRGWSEAASRAFWAMDGQFHVKIGEIAETKHMRKVVECIQSETAELGMPRDQSDMASTWDEHNAILMLIQADFPDDNAIIDAVALHARHAFQRWFNLGLGGGTAAVLERPPAHITAIALTPMMSNTEEQQLLGADLDFQRRYPNRYVAFLDIWTGDGPGRKLDRRTLATAQDLSEFMAKQSESIASRRCADGRRFREEDGEIRTAYFDSPDT